MSKPSKVAQGQVELIKKSYEWNIGLDLNNNGNITKWEATELVRQQLLLGKNYSIR